MRNERAPWTVPFPELVSHSSDFGVLMSECGRNIDAKNKLFCIVSFGAFKQHVDCCTVFE